MTILSRPLPALLLAALATLAPNVLAADSLEQGLREHHARVYAITRDFHMQTLLSGDPTRTADLKANVAAGDQEAKAWAGNTGNAATDAALAPVRAAWPTFRKLALANNILVDGYTDENLEGELYVAAESLDKALAAALLAVEGKPGKAAEAHAANVLFQRITSAYLRRAARMSPDIGAEDSFDIAAATKQLDKQLLALAQHIKGSGAAADSLRSVLGKWNFIKPSLLNYNEKTVPFIVDRYAGQVSAGLAGITAELDGK